MRHTRPGAVGSVEPRVSAEPSTSRRHTSFARLVGATGLVLLTSLLFWLLTDDAFRVTDASVSFAGMAHADEEAVRERLSDIERGPNVFRVRASEIVSELSTLTEVDAAAARVTLPAEVTVALDERDPVFIWSNGAVSWLVDEEGMLFAPAQIDDAPGGEPDGPRGAEAVEPDEATEAPPAELTLAARADLPIVQDARVTEQATVGTFLKPTDLRVMRLLLAVTPELLGSRAGALELHVDEEHGYVLESDRAWRARFGHYTPTLQPPDVIPRQVQCLRWLLASEERKLKEVWLALSDEACGTYSKTR